MNLNSWIELIGATGAIAAAGAAWFTIQQSNKQLKIEQTPYVTLDHIKRIENRYGLAIKNIGRGPAVNITFSKSLNKSCRNEPFFSNDQPHSANLMSPEESHYWMVDGNILDNLKVMENFSYVYLYFESQSKVIFRTKVKIKKIINNKGDGEYIVMENQYEELKGKVVILRFYSG